MQWISTPIQYLQPMWYKVYHRYINAPEALGDGVCIHQIPTGNTKAYTDIRREAQEANIKLFVCDQTHDALPVRTIKRPELTLWNYVAQTVLIWEHLGYWK